MPESGQGRIVFLPKTIENQVKPTPEEAEALGLYLREMFRLNGTNKFFIYHQVGSERRVDPIGVGELGDLFDIINRDAGKWQDNIEFETVTSQKDADADPNTHSGARLLIMNGNEIFTITLGKLMELIPHKTRLSDYATKTNAGFTRFATDKQLEEGTNDDTAVTPAGIRTALRKLGNIFTYQGRKPTFDDIKDIPNPSVGDVWETDDGKEYAYTAGGKWVETGITTLFLDKRYSRLNGLGTCTTAANTAAKVVTIPEISSIEKGQIVRVLFTNGNSATASMTLNVNNSGAKAVYYKNNLPIIGTLKSNIIYEFVLASDNTWKIIGELPNLSVKEVDPNGSTQIIIDNISADIWKCDLTGVEVVDGTVYTVVVNIYGTGCSVKLIIDKASKEVDVNFNSVNVIDAIHDTGKFVLEFEKSYSNTVDLHFVKKILN